VRNSPALALLLAAACGSLRAPAPGEPLRAVRSWAIQLQGLDREGAADRLASYPAELLVIDPVRSQRDKRSFRAAELVARLRKDRICLAYLNVGQAEDYRAYWAPHWKAPGEPAPGLPSYLLGADPEGWAGNYPVAYWDFRWRAVLWGSPRAPLDEILADGFDGVYLDWVAGYEDPQVAEAAQEAGVDAGREMVSLIHDLREYARRRKPRFLVVAQNAAGLVRLHPELAGLLDGIAAEDLSFRGRAGAAWEDQDSGDQPVSNGAALEKDLLYCKQEGLPVLTLDYAVEAKHAARARAVSRALGFLPFVSRTPLDRLPPAPR